MNYLLNINKILIEKYGESNNILKLKKKNNHNMCFIAGIRLLVYQSRNIEIRYLFK